MEQLINVLIFLMSVNIVINIWNIAVIRKAWRDGFAEGVQITVQAMLSTAMNSAVHKSAARNSESQKNQTP